MPETERLLLRSWRDEDLAPFAAMNADPVVMEHFPSTLTRRESDALVVRITAQLDDLGYGLWALEVRDSGEFVGFTGLALQTFPAHFTPAVEVGWRLAQSAWGHGYATEAALAALEYGFTVAGLDEIVSMTAATNVRSQQVMQRIGMTHDPADDFDHPNVPDGHRVKPHVLYRIRRP
ncbi:MAG TPA: GNAT family N-acetyltransferase [Acidimicrobiales bacterium]|nr:GNAT family N-acetyltransferase [Acidimicrobiales bacterium]